MARNDFQAVCTVLPNIEAEEESLALIADGDIGFVIEDGRDADADANKYKSEPATGNASDLDDEYSNDQPSSSRIRAHHRS